MLSNLFGNCRPKHDGENGKGLKIKRCTGTGLFADNVHGSMQVRHSSHFRREPVMIYNLMFKISASAQTSTSPRAHDE